MRKLALVFAAALAIAATPFPSTIVLPEGVAPEGIAVGHGSTFYAGSLAGGQIVRGDLAAGTVAPFVTAPSLPVAVGLGYSDAHDLLFAAGGPTGAVAVYDGSSGTALATIPLAGQGFVNDVVVTRTAAYLTNSAVGEIYKVSIGRAGAIGSMETIALSGPAADIVGPFNLNGIEATPNGKTLIAVNSASGNLFTIDPTDGSSSLIEGVSVPSGDGILLQGRTLYVVQNFLNQVAVVELSPDLGSGRVVDVITDSDFQVPTTVARHGSRLALVNAQFGIPPEVDSTFEVVIVNTR